MLLFYNANMTTLESFVPMLDTVPLPLRRFTADEYITAAEAGAFQDGRRVELIEGLVVEMSPSGSAHNHYLMVLNELFAPLINQCHIAIQGTLRIDRQRVFDPDLMLLQRKAGGYRKALPGPADVRLLIEVAETSFPRDTKIKKPVYAASGIADYWILDIDREILIVHRSPAGDNYDDVCELSSQDRISPLAAPDFTLDIASVFA